MHDRPHAIVLCERSLTWSAALAAAGFQVDCWDILPPLNPVPEFVTFHQDDARQAAGFPAAVAVAFPPCTHLSAAGALYWTQKAADGRTLQAAALLLAVAAIALAARHSLIENPAGLARRLLGDPTLIVDPWMYAAAPAENRRKRTLIWTRNWPPPFQVWSDSTAPRRFMDWAPGRSNTTRSQGWPGMAAAFIGALPR